MVTAVHEIQSRDHARSTIYSELRESRSRNIKTVRAIANRFMFSPSEIIEIAKGARNVLSYEAHPAQIVDADDSIVEFKSGNRTAARRLRRLDRYVNILEGSLRK